MCDDGDPLDILVLCSVDVPPLTLMRVKVIAVMKMIDQGDEDDKIFGIAADVFYINKYIY
jgi:inorganic pyrophosphatase